MNTPSPLDARELLHPERAVDVLADLESGVCEAVIRPTAPARITAPISTGGM